MRRLSRIPGARRPTPRNRMVSWVDHPMTEHHVLVDALEHRPSEVDPQDFSQIITGLNEGDAGLGAAVPGRKRSMQRDPALRIWVG